ncbi:hypothetical protein GMOD_00007634 [Pyrenophora seminiperda CCB06]|uniref:Uncharacterized protein n=1 Tax=Pyrenophora seminiperda CCB06 TaxID=1302712 RepID=A0A3M7ME25_9PLEO|nr:hypothetical protein GMOD_00007634 [Pyrenophora seminiperda CCB06]
MCLLFSSACAAININTATVAAAATSSVGKGRQYQSASIVTTSSAGSLARKSSAAIPQTTTSTSTTPLSSSPTDPTTAFPSPLTKSRIVGLAVGLAVADILLVGVCLYYFLYRRRGHKLPFPKLKKRSAQDDKKEDDVAELRGPPVYAQEREDEGARHEVYVEPSEVEGTVCYHELEACVRR